MARLKALLPAVLFLLAAGAPACPQDAPAKADYEDSPFGFHPAIVLGRNPYAPAKDIGVRWDRSGLYFMWVLVQPDPEDKSYDWSRYDPLFKDVPAGMWLLRNITAAHVQMIAGGPPPGAGRKGVDTSRHIKGRSYLPKDEEAYSEFVTACVERYDGDGKDDMPGLKVPVRYWQVCNEPPNGLPGYPKLVELTYKAVKKADKDAKVLIGGATGFPERYADTFTREYLPLLKELKGRYVDVFDFHWYGNASGDYRFDKVLEVIKRGLKDAGFEGIPIWITEMGSYSGKPRGRFVENHPEQTEDQQAADLFKRHVYSIARGVEKVFWAWGMMEGFKHDDGYFDHTGLIYDGEMGDDKGRGVKKKAYYTYRLMTRRLEGSDWKKIETLADGKDGVFAFRLKDRKTGNATIAAWWDYFDAEDYSPGDRKEAAFALPAGTYTILDVVTTDAGEERSAESSSEKGLLKVDLGESPIIIRAKD